MILNAEVTKMGGKTLCKPHAIQLYSCQMHVIELTFGQITANSDNIRAKIRVEFSQRFDPFPPLP